MAGPGAETTDNTRSTLARGPNAGTPNNTRSPAADGPSTGTRSNIAFGAAVDQGSRGDREGAVIVARYPSDRDLGTAEAAHAIRVSDPGGTATGARIGKDLGAGYQGSTSAGPGADDWLAGPGSDDRHLAGPGDDAGQAAANGTGGGFGAG